MTEIRKYSACDSTGHIVLTFDAFPEDAEANVPAGGRLIEGVVDGSQFYVDMSTGVVTAFSEAVRVLKQTPPTNMLQPTWDNLHFRWTDMATGDIARQLFADKVRAMRDELLAACDWTQLPDTGLTEQQVYAWRQYRAGLRNVPIQQGFPQQVTWPVAPT